MEIGKAVPLLDAVERVTGRVPYMINFSEPGMLVVKVLRSPFPHARIERLDASAALQIPGVVAVLTAADFDQPGGPQLVSGAIIKDQPVLAHEKVRYVGEPLALVAAETLSAAEEALWAIEVDYSELPSVTTTGEALQEGAPALHEAHPDNCFVHAKLRHGDLEAGFAAADEVIEETFYSPAAQQTSLEPHVTAARWQDGQLTVWTASQAPSLVRRVLADLFGLPQESVRIKVPPLGGGYGGKGHVRLEPMVACLAWKVPGRLVRLALTREEEFVTVTKHAARLVIKTGLKRDGTFTARQVTVYWNGGAYADASPGLVRGSLVRSLGPYRLPAAQVDAYGIYTNTPPAAAFRGAMSSQTTWAYESHLDTLAARLGTDPLELRLRNLLRPGDTFATGETLHDVHFVECLQSVAEDLGWDQPLAPPQGPRRRGRGLGVMIKSTPATSRSECRLVLDQAGKATLYTSTVEMGQGAHTALAQITADALGLPLEQVQVYGPDTAVTPFDTTTSASRSTSMMGGAVQRGAGNLLRKLAEAAVPLFELPAEELQAGGGFVCPTADPSQKLAYTEVLRRTLQTGLEAGGEYATQGGLDPETGQGIGSLHYHQGAAGCEVEIDIETGRVRVLRFTAASFAGRVVNPLLARLQNEGNVIYGMGQALMEEMVFSGGQVINSNLSEYQIPSFLDAPMELTTRTLEAEGSDFHGIGEMTLPPVAPAIANAIYAALGVRIRDLPITPEKVLKALQDGND